MGRAQGACAASSRREEAADPGPHARQPRVGPDPEPHARQPRVGPDAEGIVNDEPR
jgi:hypothetical protein